MKKFILVFYIFTITIFFAQDNPMVLPKVDIQIDDIKKIDITLEIDDFHPVITEITELPKPELSEEIKIDLEKTLPEKIDAPEKQKPVDALMTFGYGLNNYLFADFTIFIKQYNPKVAIRYTREARDNLWFNKPEIKSPMSKDDLNAQIIYSYKNFNLDSEAGFYSHTYDLQDKSIYPQFTKRIINADLNPKLKFNYQNDLSLQFKNDFIITEAKNSTRDDNIERSGFSYQLQSDLMYSQIFGNTHFFSTHAGYDFQYLYSLIAGGEDLADDYDQQFFNTIKAGANYSTTIKDTFTIKGSFDFIGMFREKEFNWYLLPVNHFGYNLKNIFYCYIEGGGDLHKKPDQIWYKKYQYVIMPLQITPGYHWYALTGVKLSYPGWITVFTDFEFAYNQNAFNWEKINEEENLYSYTKHDYIELNLSAGFVLNVKEYMEIKALYTHRFYEPGRPYLTARDSLTSEIKWMIPKIGLSFFVDFEGQFYRITPDETVMGNVYLMNAGIDWNWQERIGLGMKFHNILYFQDYQLFPDYNEAGFGFLTYMKIGF